MHKASDWVLKNKIIIIVLVFAVAMIIFLFFNNQNNVYYDQQTGISLNLPKNWLELSKDDVTTYNPEAKIGFIKTDSEDTTLGFRIDEVPGKENFKIQESLEVIKQGYQEKIDDFTIIDEKISSFLNTPSIDLTYSYSVPTDDKGGKYRGTQRQILFLHNEKFYRLMFNTSPKDFERDNKDFEKMLNTFKISN